MRSSKVMHRRELLRSTCLMGSCLRSSSSQPFYDRTRIGSPVEGPMGSASRPRACNPSSRSVKLVASQRNHHCASTGRIEEQVRQLRAPATNKQET